jgi:high-affinity iron transporter
MVLQVWYGAAFGLLLCLIIGGGLIGAFYGLGKDRWASVEYYWEGSFAVCAALVITIMGVALLRVSKMQEKWRPKLAKALEEMPITAGGKKGALKRWCEKYAMLALPFITVLREGLEAVVFIAGVSFSSPAAAVRLPVVVGLIAGAAAGFIIYKTAHSLKLIQDLR